MEQTPQTTITSPPRTGEALTVRRLFTRPGVHPFDEVEWELRDARIGHGDKVAFEQRDVEFPKSWSQNATNIVAQKYFRGQLSSPTRERSVKQMVAPRGGDDRRLGPRARLLQLGRGRRHVRGGADLHPRCTSWRRSTRRCGSTSASRSSRSARPASSSRSRTRWTRSSTGTRARGASSAAARARASTSRRSAARWSRCPRAAPPRVRSPSCAGRTRGPARSSPAARRAARPRWWCSTSTTPTSATSSGARRSEEDKAAALRDAGFDMSIDGDGFQSIQYQNANNSVRVTDEFMHAVENDEDWHLLARTTGEPVGEPVRARELMREISEAAWRCADPGVQYDTTINQWHTSPNSGRINASNPCSEYMHVDDSACNLASLNLMKFRRPDGTFDTATFSHAVDIVFLAQEIVVGPSSYPTKEIGENARAFRQLGLGYANLGAYLMANGFAYDSDEGRGVGGGDHRADDRARLPAVGQGRRGDRPVRPLRGEPRGAQQRDAHASRRLVRDPRQRVRGHGAADRLARVLERGGRGRRALRLPQRAGDRARAHGDDLVPDGLRHDRHRARLLAGQVQGAGRRRLDDDRQPHGADGAGHARLQRGADRADRGVRRRARHDRRRAGPGPPSTCRCSTSRSASGRSRTPATSR